MNIVPRNENDLDNFSNEPRECELQSSIKTFSICSS